MIPVSRRAVALPAYCSGGIEIDVILVRS